VETVQRNKIIINTSNLQVGGALQVASSFIYEASKHDDIDFTIILGKKSSKAIPIEDFEEYKNMHFIHIDFHPSESIVAYFRFQQELKVIEKKIKPLGVITVFGPCYWKPTVPHVMGFANGYLIYEDTYFFKKWKEWKSLGYQLKKKFQRYLLRREAKRYWTETEDSKKRLSKFMNRPKEHIIVATNNCSNHFREKVHPVFLELPAKKAFRLLYVSSYYPHKGFELIPPVLKRMAVEKIEVEVVLTIRDDEFRRIFHEFKNVINLGSVLPKNVPYLYEQADIVFVPTLLETFSAVYPEAMYMERPILTTDLPFSKDICKNAALYFDPDSIDDCVSKIMQLMTSDGLRKELVNNGLKRVEDFDLPETRFKKILDFLLKGQ